MPDGFTTMQFPLSVGRRQTFRELPTTLAQKLLISPITFNLLPLNDNEIRNVNWKFLFELRTPKRIILNGLQFVEQLHSSQFKFPLRGKEGNQITNHFQPSAVPLSVSFREIIPFPGLSFLFRYLRFTAITAANICSSQLFLALKCSAMRYHSAPSALGSFAYELIK